MAPKKPLPRTTGRDMPHWTQGGRNLYPFRYMRVGDSFAVDPRSGQNIHDLARSVRTSAKRLTAQVADRTTVRFETHVITEDGHKRVRCWRVQ